MSNLSERLQQARKIAGLSLRGLADRVGLSHAAIKKYEDGKVYPSSDILIKLANALNVRIDFFFRPISVSLENVKFRKRQELSKKAEETIKFSVLNQVERRLELENLYPDSPVASFSLPRDMPNKIHSLDEIELLAEKLRKHWKLGIDPIHNLIDALETYGIRVFIVDVDEEHFDGLSTIIKEQPIIVVGSRWPGDRQRFNLIHELAHYILKDRLSAEINEEEACNRFSGAFLFPREAVLNSFGKERSAIEWPELLQLKRQFQLSMVAICHRLRDLRIIEESYYVKLREGIRRNGWQHKEPGVEISPEKAQTFYQLLFHALAENYIGESKAAELLACTLLQLKAIRQAQNEHSYAN